MAYAKESFFESTYFPSPLTSRAERSIVADPDEVLTMSVLVRRSLDSLRLDAAEESRDAVAGHRRYLSREDVARMFGADLEYVAASSRKHGLTVLEANAARRMLVVKGTLQQIRGFVKVDLIGSVAWGTPR